jgi:hypothetical protein
MWAKAGDCGNSRSFFSLSAFFLTERLLGGRREPGSTLFWEKNREVAKLDSVTFYLAVLPTSIDYILGLILAEPRLSRKPPDAAGAFLSKKPTGVSCVYTICVRFIFSLSSGKIDRLPFNAVTLGLRCPLLVS